MTKKEKRVLQIEYIKRNCDVYTVSRMSKNIGLSVSTVNRILRDLGINKRKTYTQGRGGKYNPNPVTLTTYMLVCRYHFEGSGINVIAHMLNRPPAVIEQILDECKRNGNYDKYNKFGRTEKMFYDIKNKNRDNSKKSCN